MFAGSWRHCVLLCTLVLSFCGTLFATHSDATTGRLRRIILHSRHTGAHGLGYSKRSLIELSHKIAAGDIPGLLALHKTDRELRVGIEFALASQCEAAIQPVHDSATQLEMPFADGEEVMDIIAGFSACPPQVQQRALLEKKELGRLSEIDLPGREAAVEKASAGDTPRTKKRIEVF